MSPVPCSLKAGGFSAFCHFANTSELVGKFTLHLRRWQREKNRVWPMRQQLNHQQILQDRIWITLKKTSNPKSRNHWYAKLWWQLAHPKCPPLTISQWLLIVATVLSSTFLFSLDNTIVADIQSPVVEKFGEIGKLSWLGVAFVLASSSTLVTW